MQWDTFFRHFFVLVGCERPSHPRSKSGKGLIDFSGTIAGRVGKCDFSISFLKNHRGSIVLIIEGSESRYIRDEINGLALRASRLAEWRWENPSFESGFVSETATRVVSDLLEMGSCKLPKLSEARHLHGELFGVLNNHIKMVTGNEVDVCPVT